MLGLQGSCPVVNCLQAASKCVHAASCVMSAARNESITTVPLRGEPIEISAVAPPTQTHALPPNSKLPCCQIEGCDCTRQCEDSRLLRWLSGATDFGGVHCASLCGVFKLHAVLSADRPLFMPVLAATGTRGDGLVTSAATLGSGRDSFAAEVLRIFQGSLFVFGDLGVSPMELLERSKSSVVSLLVWAPCET